MIVGAVVGPAGLVVEAGSRGKSGIAGEHGLAVMAAVAATWYQSNWSKARPIRKRGIPLAVTAVVLRTWRWMCEVV